MCVRCFSYLLIGVGIRGWLYPGGWPMVAYFGVWGTGDCGGGVVEGDVLGMVLVGCRLVMVMGWECVVLDGGVW